MSGGSRRFGVGFSLLLRKSFPLLLKLQEIVRTIENITPESNGGTSPGAFAARSARRALLAAATSPDRTCTTRRRISSKTQQSPRFSC
jgi:hypothetical protein